ncbi:MAG: hypothetical protein ABI867_38540 [Kofleriaceae bacterium]
MKRIILLVAAISCLGACEASVQTAPARPVAVYEPAPAPQPVYEPGPAPAPPPAPRPDQRWQQLADRYSAETNAQQIILKDKGEFRAFRIEGDRGGAFITKVTVDYLDGSAPQVVQMNTRLSPGESRTIDLNGGRRAVRRVIVYTDTSRGSYSVYGA